MMCSSMQPTAIINQNPSTGKATKQCFGHHKIKSNNIMVRRSFSNPLFMMRSFSAGRNQKGNSGKQDRKVSIDQTVLSGDDSPALSASQDFSRSSDAIDSGIVEVFPPNFAQGYAVPLPEQQEHSNDGSDSSNNIKESRSDPSFLTHPSDIDGSLHSSISHDGSLIHQGIRYSPHSYPRSRYGYTPQRTSGMVAPPSPPQQRARSVSSSKTGKDDPALQARTEAIRIQQQLLGENHPDVIFALSSLAKLHQRRGNSAEAASILKESKMRSKLAKSAPSKIFGARSRQNPQEIPSEIFFSR
mmetsp:Transcript_24364/g.51033  ORF Transcript_24364/g.51033 Transcript_24364/m.51033 type:complete len:300 (+) Transcript_24364:121-1020(+)